MKINRISKALTLTILLALSVGAGKAYASLTSSTTVIGDISNPARPSLGRDGGLSVKLGNKILWMFGDTLFSPASVDGTHLRTNTAALADINNPYELSEPLDANGAPYQFIPFSAEQQSYNDNSTDKSHDRYIIWPDRAINIDANSAYVFYKNIKATPTSGGSYTLSGLGIGVARVEANSTTATRIQDTLFSANEDNYVPEVIHGDYVYAFHCVNGFFVGNCAVARVPKAEILTRSSYRFWNGSTWQTDITSATHDILGSTSSMSVIYSQYLKKYLMLGAVPFDTKLYFKTADNIEGPWTEKEFFYDHGSQIYGGRLHQELSSSDGQTIVFTHTSNTGMKVVSLTFDPTNKGAGTFTLTGRDAFLTEPTTEGTTTNKNSSGTGQTGTSNLNGTPGSSSYPLSPKTGILLGTIITASSLLAFAISVFIETKKHKQKTSSSDK